MEDVDDQKRPERVTNESYPDNVDAHNTNPVGDDKPTNKRPPNGALHTISGNGE
jgi:hypothetical protein